jgi:hypothetical protein
MGNGKYLRYMKKYRGVESCAFAQYSNRVVLQDLTRKLINDFIYVLLDNQVDCKIREAILIKHFILWTKRCSRIFQDTDQRLPHLLEEVRS